LDRGGFECELALDCKKRLQTILLEIQKTMYAWLNWENFSDK